ncbi:hypothetical protein [Candidatus Entotheonella palauensis]|uniref:hypothetical protein n=1 Tax=Candidatus Entotheonella palauensis TaxID=93172 RepID=UPI000B7F2387|nr:hypothetical protein [Candidatus Entotheonella palauensis]
MPTTYEPYQCQSCRTVLVFDDREPLANASCPLCLSRITIIEAIEETWKGFVCHHCGRHFSIQASRTPYKCPICTLASLAPAPQEEPHLFGLRYIKAVHVAETSAKRLGGSNMPWQPVTPRQETWKDWMEGLFLLVTDEIGFFVFLAALGSVIGILVMIFRLLSWAIS